LKASILDKDKQNHFNMMLLMHSEAIKAQNIMNNKYLNSFYLDFFYLTSKHANINEKIKIDQ